MMYTRVICLLLVVNVLLVSGQSVVRLPFGQIEGMTVTIEDAKVHAFLGIPYAMPPVGDLRFKKPEPWSKNWRGIRSAIGFPKSCLQPLIRPGETYSEDCLGLNVWTTTTSSETKGKPVLVYIHGGGFIFGSSADKTINGAKLAKTIDAVVVTMNYRLGALGFMYGGSDRLPGNLGLFDQALALQWVKNYIDFFGGDPNSVTVSGESAGSMSISLHVVSSISTNLFNNAILMSGVALDERLLLDQETALRKTSALSEAVGCGKSNGKAFTNETINCLKNVDGTLLSMVQMSPQVLNCSAHGAISFMPLFGDEFIPEKPLILLEKGKYQTGLSIMAGTVSYEGTAIEFFTSALGKQILENSPNLKTGYETWFRAAPFLMGQNLSGPANDAVKLYFGDIKKDADARNSFLEGLGDLYFDCPTKTFARHLSRRNTVHQFVFTHQVNATGCPGTSPCHADDVGIFFGTVLETKNDHRVWQQISGVLRKFVRSGETGWMPYYRTSSNFLVPSFLEFGSRNNEGPKEHEHRGLTCQFWDKALGGV